MKTSVILSTLVLFCPLLGAQNYNVYNEVAQDRLKAGGLDNIISFDVPPLTKDPKGYEAFYISHYGRHGSRYAYTDKTYTTLLKMMKQADSTDNLTEYGRQLLDSVTVFYDKVKYHTGDLTEAGWNQHRVIAGTMVKNFPSAFGKDARVDAVVSKSTRSIVSMTSFCTELARLRPSVQIYAHQGFLELQVTAPNLGENELRYKGPKLVNPYSEDYESFLNRKMPRWKDIYARIFKNAEKALAGKSPARTTFYTYMLVAGMPSLPEENRVNLDGIFTEKEFAAFWEVDNYMRFKEYYKYQTSCCSILDDIVAKADARIAGGERGADLRFGHDHVMMTLYMLLNMDNFGHHPASNDELAYWFQSYRSPMGTNLQIVFYRPKHGKEGDILVKLISNGIECHFSDVSTEMFPYYRWNDVKTYIQSRVKHFTL